MADFDNGVGLISQARGEESVSDLISQNTNELRNELSELYDKPAVDSMGFNDYYANTSAGIQKGTYSGQSFSAPIFTPNFLRPMARRDAVDKAEYDNKVAKIQEALKASQGLNDMMAPPDLNNPYMQEKFNDTFYNDIDSNWVQKFAKQYPNDWQQRLLDDQGFKRTLNNYSIMAKGTNEMTDKMAKYLADYETGKVNISPESLTKIQEVMSGISQFGNEGFSAVDINKNLKDIDAEIALGGFLESAGILDRIKPIITDRLSKVTSKVNTLSYQKDTEKIYDEAVESVAEELTRKGGIYQNSKVYTKDYIKNYMKGILGNEHTITNEAIKTDDVPRGGNSGGVPEWQWNAMDNEQKKISMLNTIQKFVNFEQVGALVGKNFAGGTVTDERLFNAMDKTELDKYIANHKKDIINPDGLRPDTRYNIITVNVKGSGGAPDKTKYYFMDADSPNAAMTYGAALKGGDEKPYYPSPDDISNAFKNSGQSKATSGATVLSGEIDPSTLITGNSYSVNGKEYTWNGTNLVAK